MYATAYTDSAARWGGQETTGAYIDDATITTQVKSRMLDNPNVAGTSISVEMLDGKEPVRHSPLNPASRLSIDGCMVGRSRSWFATGAQQSPAARSGVWNPNGRMPHAARAQEH